MKKTFVPLLVYLCIFSASSTKAQYYYHNDKYWGSDFVVELGVTAGVMNSLTDLGGKKGIGKNFIKDLNWKVTKPSFGLYLVGMYKEALGIRLEGTFGTLNSYDSILKKVAASTFGRYERNLSFRTKITDIQLSAEIHPLFFKNYGENEAPYWSPYLVAGIGFFTFNPEAELNGNWYYLHPLRTEGQGFAEYPDRKQYALTQFNVPLGIGVRYEVNNWLNARLEFVHRFLFTDYLDDVSTEYIDPALFVNYLQPAQASIAAQLHDRRITTIKDVQRGDPKDNDAYFSIQLKIGMAIRTTRR